MDELEKNIRKKLKEFGLQSFDELNAKTQQRIIEIEKAMERYNNIRTKCVKRYNDYQITIKSISNSEEVSISRQTIYNHNILKTYIEESKEKYNEGDKFAKNNVQRIKEQRDEIQMQFDKMIGELIKMQNLKLDAKRHMKEINKLVKEKKDLMRIIKAKDEEIDRLKQIIKKEGKNNLIEYSKFKE